MNAPSRAPARRIVQCLTCGADIFWAVSTKNRAMPINAQPTADGDLILTRRLDGVLVAIALKDGDPSTDPRFVSHLIMCPDAGTFRRSVKRSGTMRSPS